MRRTAVWSTTAWSFSVFLLGACDGSDATLLDAGDELTDASAARDAAAPGNDAGAIPTDASISMVDAALIDAGTSTPDAGPEIPDAGPARPCEFPAGITNQVEMVVTAADWTFSETYQTWNSTVTVSQTLRQREHFGVRVVFEGVRPRHEAYFRRHDSDPDDGVDDSLHGHSTLSFRARQATPGVTRQPLFYDASVPSGTYRPVIETGPGDIPGVGGFVTPYNNTIDYVDFGLNTQTPGVIQCALLWGTPLFPPPEQSRSSMDVTWEISWSLPVSDRNNDDGYSPILEAF